MGRKGSKGEMEVERNQGRLDDRIGDIKKLGKIKSAKIHDHQYFVAGTAHEYHSYSYSNHRQIVRNAQKYHSPVLVLTGGDSGNT